PAAPPVAAVPAGMTFRMELAQPILTDLAAAGDRFWARLLTPLRQQGKKPVAPKGAMVAGRLLRVEMHHLGRPEALVVFRPESVTVNGVKVPLAARPNVSPATAQRARQGKRPVEILLPAKWETNAGVYRFPSPHAMVLRSFVSEWRTVTP